MENNEQPWGMNTNTYCMLMHLSQLLSILFWGLGLVVPIVMWVANKDRFYEVDQQGKSLLNWLISLTIYGLVLAILALVLLSMGIVGNLGFFTAYIFIVLYMVVGLFIFVCVIVSAIKANDGTLWEYPLTIDFFGVFSTNKSVF